MSTLLIREMISLGRSQVLIYACACVQDLIGLSEADIGDYFNYGFNEQTWRMYAHKQRTIRQSNGSFPGGLVFITVLLAFDHC